MSLSEQIKELEDKIEELKSQVERDRDYSIVEEDSSDYQTCLSDSEGEFILSIDSLDELEDSNDVESGIKLYNTDLYEWVINNSNARYEFVLKRK